jgi:hypothetical protein
MDMDGTTTRGFLWNIYQNEYFGGTTAELIYPIRSSALRIP